MTQKERNNLIGTALVGLGLAGIIIYDKYEKRQHEKKLNDQFQALLLSNDELECQLDEEDHEIYRNEFHNLLNTCEEAGISEYEIEIRRQTLLVDIIQRSIMQ